MEQASGLPGAGPLIVLGLGAWLVRRAGAEVAPPPAFAGALGAVMLFSVIAVGRTALGVQQSEASRYVYIAVALVLPAIGLALHDLTGRQATGHVAVLVVLLLVAVHNVGVLRDQSRVQAEQEKRFRTAVVAAAELASSPDEAILNDRIDPVFNPDLVVADLRRLRRDGKLPDLPLTVADRLAVATVLQYTVGAPAAGTPSTPARLERVTGATEARTGPGCARLTPGTGGANPARRRTADGTDADGAGRRRDQRLPAGSHADGRDRPTPNRHAPSRRAAHRQDDGVRRRADPATARRRVHRDLRGSSSERRRRRARSVGAPERWG